MQGEGKAYYIKEMNVYVEDCGRDSISQETLREFAVRGYTVHMPVPYTPLRRSRLERRLGQNSRASISKER